MTDAWRNDTFGCEDKMGICVKTYVCPHCTLAQAQSDYDGSNCIFNCCFAHHPSAVRATIRHGYGIEGTCPMDCICGHCCGMCTIAQLAKEVQLRGPIQALTGTAAAQTSWSNPLIAIDMECIYALFCHWCAAATARSDFDGSNWCYNVIQYPHYHLSVIRNGYNIAGSCLMDILTMQFCTCCAVARMKKETAKRGFCVAKGSSAPTGAQMN